MSASALSLRPKGLFWYTDGSRTTGRSAACVRVVMLYDTAFQLDIFAILASAKECTGWGSPGEHTYTLKQPRSLWGVGTALRNLEAPRVMSKLEGNFKGGGGRVKRILCLG